MHTISELLLHHLAQQHEPIIVRELHDGVVVGQEFDGAAPPHHIEAHRPLPDRAQDDGADDPEFRLRVSRRVLSRVYVDEGGRGLALVDQLRPCGLDVRIRERLPSARAFTAMLFTKSSSNDP